MSDAATVLGSLAVRQTFASMPSAIDQQRASVPTCQRGPARPSHVAGYYWTFGRISTVLDVEVTKV